jgi:hypothetical protein
LPILLLFILILILNNTLYLLSIILIAGILFLLYFAVIGMIKWKSISVGLQIPLIIILIMTAWSCGFLREWIFPLPPSPLKAGLDFGTKNPL